MKRATIFVACACVLAACVNDFDALFEAKPGATDGGKSSSSGAPKPDDDDDVIGEGADGGPSDPIETDCTKNTCKVDQSGSDGVAVTQIADKCCTYGIACATSVSCDTTCSNGAICSGLCESEVSCSFVVKEKSTAILKCTVNNCSMDCTGGSKCALDCNADNCQVQCDESSTCVVTNCFGDDGCDVSCGGKPADKCPGNVRACGGCPK